MSLRRCSKVCLLVTPKLHAALKLRREMNFSLRNSPHMFANGVTYDALRVVSITAGKQLILPIRKAHCGTKQRTGSSALPRHTDACRHSSVPHKDSTWHSCQHHEEKGCNAGSGNANRAAMLRCLYSFKLALAP